MAFTNSQHTVKRFDAELSSLIGQVLEMGRAAERQVAHAVEAIKTGDIELARAVVAADDSLNRRDLDIDQACIRLLARRQPVSTDMRLVISLNKAVSDLERIGDEAKTIANQALSIRARGGELPGGIGADLGRLAQLVLQRLRATQEAMARLDAEQSWRLVHQGEDDVVEQAFQDNLRSLSTHALDGGLAVATMIDVVLAFKALKRVSEHAENLAEHVIFVVEGRNIRHAL